MCVDNDPVHTRVPAPSIHRKPAHQERRFRQQRKAQTLVLLTITGGGRKEAEEGAETSVRPGGNDSIPSIFPTRFTFF